MFQVRLLWHKVFPVSSSIRNDECWKFQLILSFNLKPSWWRCFHAIAKHFNSWLSLTFIIDVWVLPPKDFVPKLISRFSCTQSSHWKCPIWWTFKSKNITFKLLLWQLSQFLGGAQRDFVVERNTRGHVSVEPRGLSRSQLPISVSSRARNIKVSLIPHFTSRTQLQPACREINQKDADIFTGFKSCVSSVHLQVHGTIEFSCLEGHILEGEDKAFCTRDGVWSSRAPTCRYVECPRSGR